MKTDITINKSMLIAPKQFENIKPNVSITVKDVSIENLGDAQSTLNEIAEELWKLEVINQYYLYKGIKDKGLDVFCQETVDNVNDIIESLEKNQNLLIKMNNNNDKF